MLNFDWLTPLPAAQAKWIFFGLYGLIVVAIWLLRKEYVFAGLERPRIWHNLKWWATLVMGLLAAVYWYF